MNEIPFVHLYMVAIGYTKLYTILSVHRKYLAGKNWQIMTSLPVFLANIHIHQKCIWHMH